MVWAWIRKLALQMTVWAVKSVHIGSFFPRFYLKLCFRCPFYISASLKISPMKGQNSGSWAMVIKQHQSLEVTWTSYILSEVTPGWMKVKTVAALFPASVQKLNIMLFTVLVTSLGNNPQYSTLPYYTVCLVWLALGSGESSLSYNPS